MAVSTSLVNSVGFSSAFTQVASSTVTAAQASISTTRINNASTQSNIANEIDLKIKKKNEEIDFFLDRIIIIDGQKIDVDNSINRLDKSTLDEIESVNNKLRDLKTAYQNRVNAGVRTDLFWRVVGDYTVTTGGEVGGGGKTVPAPLTTTTTIKLKCVKTSVNGYPKTFFGKTKYTTTELYKNQYFGYPLPPLDDGTTLRYINSSGKQNTKITNFPPLGFLYDNLYGLKYYDQPYAVDILDTYIASFPGYISVGSTVLTVAQLQSSGVTSRIKVGQNLICNKSSVFASGNEIVGIGTTVLNLDYSTEKIQATAVSSISSAGIVTSITVTTAGLGYTTYPSLPTVTIQPPNGNAAIGTAIVSAAGTISSIQLSNVGSGYTIAPTVTISAPFVSSAIGIGTTGSAGIVTDVFINYGGFGYTSAPTVIFDDPPVIGVGIGTTAEGTATLGAGNTVTSVTITNPGYGYTTSPVVYFSSPGITTATATAFISSAGVVTSVTIVNPGVAYTTDSEYLPIVVFSLPPVVGAAATVTVSIGGTIDSVNITNPGAGYTFAPSVTIQSPYNDVVPVLYLETPASDSASYPESNGSIITFTALSSSEVITSIASTSVQVPFGLNPYSPENIGIMKTTQLGIGVSLKYDNSGYPDTIQTWRPELKRDAVVYNGVVTAEAIQEPLVGAGKILYNVGFTVKPRYPTNSTYTTWRDAVENDTLTLVYKTGYDDDGFGFSPSTYVKPPSLSSFVTNCDPDTGGYDAAITTAQNNVNTAKSQIAAGISTLNQKITVSNSLRKIRNDYNIQIWSQRQLFGQLLSEIDELNATKTAMSDPVIAGIIS